MSGSPTARLACVSPEFVTQATASQLDDWLTYFDPHSIILTGATPAPRAASTLRRHSEQETPLVAPAGNAPQSGLRVINDVQFVFAPTTTALREIATAEHDELDPQKPTYVLSNLLELDVDTTTLSTSLVGRDEYLDAVSPEQLAGEYIHVSSRLPVHYRRQWGSLTVIGGGVESGAAGTPLVALDCRGDGQVLTRTLHPRRLGLQALDSVGRTRARRLRDAGFTARADIATAEIPRLTDIQGIGRATATRIQQSARAIANGEVVRTSDDPLPTGEPLYIDIETDGLNPTITWLIGVLDGSGADGRFMSFIQRDPDEPGRAIEDFMAWYTANAHHRPLVAYRGWNFDFTVLHDHIIEYCPHYEDDWTSTYRFDPYEWAVEKGNAILPGRTNQLADVAAALGYEYAEPGVTGSAVARAYQQWMTDRSAATEPEWDRFKTYCEDDVRALAVVYDALAESTRIISTGTPRQDVTETTTQGSLSDW